jgi:16S rRNA (guanine1207-N2)-methyltransferase
VPPPTPDGADQYFAASPTVASAPRQVDLVLPEGELIHLTTDAGVFSAERVDPGTRALLVEGPPLPVDRPAVLADVGCGYGAIAVALARRAGPDSTIWAVDVNERARDLCRTNAEANDVADRIRVVAPHEVPADLVLDQLWSNPPIRVGKVALHDLLGTWLVRLRPGIGTAALVVQKHLGADSLVRWLDTEGWPTERRASRSGYRILSVGPRSNADTSGAPAHAQEGVS